MGTANWACYKPEDVNHAARENVKDWDMNNRDLPTELEPAKSADKGKISGIAFTLTMAALLVGTYFLYLR